MRARIGLAAGLVFGLASGSVAAQTPPWQAANAGFTRVLFNSQFAYTSIAAQLSCAGAPQTAPWKQGLWFEGWKPAGVAPCNQINIVYDPVFGQNVLDLAWTSWGNHDAFNDTSISTFPLDGVSPHFAFQHGYIEVVMRVSTMATGVWPAIWTWGDGAASEPYRPPYTATLPAGEFDVMEAWGGSPSGLASNLHEWYHDRAPTGANLFNNWPPSIDVTKPHTYGLLWVPNGSQYQQGYICSYIDNIWKGCANTTAPSESQAAFLILGMGVGCHFNNKDLSCVGGLSRADMYVSRVTVFGW